MHPSCAAERTEARALAASQTPEFAALAPGDQISLLLGHEMTPKWGHYVRDLTGFSLLDWMDFRAYSPDPAELTQAVLDAVRLWEAKVAARSRPGG